MCQMLIAIVSGLMMPTAVPIGAGDDIPDNPERWIVTDPPELYSERWWAAYNSDYDWVVSLRDGRPRVEPWRPVDEAAAPLPFEIEPGTSREGLAGSRLQVEVADGWIVAFNAGEFGAGVWWFSPDGTERYKIAEAWVVRFFQTEEALLVLEGLAHGAALNGQILRLFQDPSGRWRSESWVDLGNAPLASTTDADGKLLVATTERLLRVDPANREVEVVFDGDFWGGLCPNSVITTPTGTIYLGMPHGVARIETKGEGKRVGWLLPNKAFVEMRSNPSEGFEGLPLEGFKEM